jgi:UDP-N-acetylglucosamine 2-epimerase (non-hydrolysing)
MLDQVLTAFHLKPEYDLDIMRDKQTLFDITENVLQRLVVVLDECNPDIVLVHGDTTTTFSAALTCFYKRIDIGHVEAGLRTYDKYAPYPEEFNRQAIGIVAKYNFAPTVHSRDNLLREGKTAESIYITGNTAIDALRTTVQQNYKHELLDWAYNSRLILITIHRRENIGHPMSKIFKAIRRAIDNTSDAKAFFPSHKNPSVRQIAEQELHGCDRIRIVEPLDVIDFHNILSRSYMIVTDSGGVQEEAPSLGKPVLVARETTERPEGIVSGSLRLVGSKEENVYSSIMELLSDKSVYEKMSKASNPYGDGFASVRIADILESSLQ